MNKREKEVAAGRAAGSTLAYAVTLGIIGCAMLPFVFFLWILGGIFGAY